MTSTPKKLANAQASLRERIAAGHWRVGEKLPNDADLALELGCSIGTVSKALALLAHDGLVARKPRVGTTLLRDSSRPAVTELDAFAFLYPSSRHEGISGMLNGFEGAAREKGRRLVTLPTGLDFKKEAEIIARLEEFDVRGVVACPIIATPEDQLKISQLLLGSRIPVVLAGLSLSGFSAASVLLDNYQAGYEMTQHLIRRGAKRIGFLSNHSWIQYMRDRYFGYQRAMADAGLPIEQAWVYLAHAMHANVQRPTDEPSEMAEDYLASRPGVEAVVCGNDFMAVGLMEAVRKTRFKQLLVTGIDDFTVARESSLTTYRVPYEEMGRRSFEVLEALVMKRPSPEVEVCLRGEVVVRETA